MASINQAGVGIRQGVKMKATNKFLKRLSKAAQVGGTYRIIIPTYTDAEGLKNAYAAKVTGRNVDFDIFKSSFMAYKDDWYETDANGLPDKDLTGVNSYAKICKIIFEAQCESEKEAAKNEANAIASTNGGQVNEQALLRKLDRIDEKFHGRKAEDGVSATYPTVSPAIRGLANQVIVEMLMVPMDNSTNTPQWDKAEYVFKECSEKILNQFITFLDNPSFCAADRDYLELSFTYGTVGQNSTQAGQSATFSGVSTNLSLESMFPSEWERVGKAKVEGINNGERDLAKAGDIILSHSGYRVGSLTPEDIKSMLQKWVSENMIILTHINMTDPSTEKGAKDLVDSGLVDGVSAVKEKLIQLCNKNDEDNQSVSVPVNNPAPAAAPASAPVANPAQAVQQMAPTPEQQAPVTPSSYVPVPEGGIDLRTASANVALPTDEEMGDLLEV